MSTFDTPTYQVDFTLHSLGWKVFQDLCAQVMEEELTSTVSVYREAQDGSRRTPQMWLLRFRPELD